jgi:hypothetical protein
MLEYFYQSTNHKIGVGSCSVKKSLHNNNIKDYSFDKTMEENWLVAIIGKLAQEWGDKEDGEKKELYGIEQSKFFAHDSGA